MTGAVIRRERAGDAAAIQRVVSTAFATAPHAGGDEADVVEALRAAGAMTVSLVATAGDDVIGHVAFSPVRISSGARDWYGLGPLAVLPDRRRRGVGARLVEGGLEALRASGAAGCVVLGDPRYYGRFGFAHHPALSYPGPPPEYFQALALSDRVPSGVVAYHDAFGGGGEGGD